MADSAAETFSIGDDGRQWLGVSGSVGIRDPGGALVTLRVPGTEAPAVEGWIEGSAYLRSGDTLSVMPADGDSVTAVRGDFGANPLLVDVRGRALLQGARSGAVLAHDPRTLAPVWAWAALGSATTALAGSPEGDRVYQALASSGGDARLLIRDLQTGRELASVELPAPLALLAAGADGTLYGMAREGRRAAIVALRPARNDLELVWRRVLPMSGEADAVRLAVAGQRLAVWGLGPRVGLRLLATRTGEIVARTRVDPRDAAFGRGAELWALYPGEIRRLE